MSRVELIDSPAGPLRLTTEGRFTVVALLPPMPCGHVARAIIRSDQPDRTALDACVAELVTKRGQPCTACAAKADTVPKEKLIVFEGRRLTPAEAPKDPAPKGGSK